ncbi:MAG: hypothetical protein AB3N33_00290 [Puniceicoccaceae bacterium]
MKQKRAVIAGLFVSGMLCTHGEQIVEDLGNFPNSQITQVVPIAVSDDGSVVVGNGVDSVFNDNTNQYDNFETGFRWEKSTGMVGLGNSPSEAWKAQAVSGDGQIIAGVTIAPTLYLNAGETTRYIDGMGYVGAISGDGTTLVGSGGPFPRHFLILKNLSVEKITDLKSTLSPDDPYNDAIPMAISYQGNIIAGSMDTSAFRLKDEVMTTARNDASDLNTIPRAMNSEGSLIVGVRTTSGFLKRGFTWDGASSNVSDLPLGTYNQTEAKDVSGDGSIIIGEGIDGFSRRFAIKWVWEQNAYQGPMLLGDDGTNTISGFSITSANAISRDGTVIVGTGSYGSGGSNMGYRLILDAVVWSGLWEVAEDNVSVDTGKFLGWIDVSSPPWVFIYALGKWAYLPEEFVSEAGGWAYLGQ